MMQKTWKITETLANGYSSESAPRELSNEYQHDRVRMVFKNNCICVLLDESRLSIGKVKRMCGVWPHLPMSAGNSPSRGLFQQGNTGNDRTKVRTAANYTIITRLCLTASLTHDTTWHHMTITVHGKKRQFCHFLPDSSITSTMKCLQTSIHNH